MANSKWNDVLRNEWIYSVWIKRDCEHFIHWKYPQETKIDVKSPPKHFEYKSDYLSKSFVPLGLKSLFEQWTKTNGFEFEVFFD